MKMLLDSQVVGNRSSYCRGCEPDIMVLSWVIYDKTCPGCLNSLFIPE
jgi:hypothetical protein